MNNTVTFKVAGNDVLSFMDKMKSKADVLTTEMINNAKKQTDSAKDQLKTVEDQIKAIERKNKIEAEGNRQKAANDRRDRVDELEAARTTALSKLPSTQGRNKPFTDAVEKNRQRINDNIDAQIEAEKGKYRDAVHGSREQERQATLQTKLMRDNIEAIKSTSNAELNQMRKGDDSIVEELGENATPMQQMARDIAEERYDKEKSDKEEKEDKKGRPGLFAELMSVENLNRFLNTASRFAGTQNGFDLIQPASQGIGQIAGSIIGGIIGTLIEPGGGTLVGAGIGGSIGSTIGGGVGEFEQRRAMAAQDFLGAKYRLEATTQRQVNGIPDMSNMGVSAAQYFDSMRGTATAAGTANRGIENTNDMLEMEKGLGVGKDVSMQLLTLFRGTSKDISNLVGGIMAKDRNSVFGGGDYTFLNEFMGKFVQLQTQLRSSAEDVHTGTTLDILNRFDKVGGMFSARDPRSSGLISQINNALVNPGTDSLKAYSMLALRQANPNMNLADLMVERGKGLSSPTYLKSMLGYVDMLGGDESTKRLNIAGMFGINDAAAKRLYQNKDALMSGQMSQEDIERLTSSDFKSAAEGKTTALEKNTASIQNALLSDWTMTLDKMQEAFKVAMESAFNGATIEMKNGQITFAPGAAKKPVDPNDVVRPNKLLTRNQARANGLNEDGTLNMSSVLNKF